MSVVIEPGRPERPTTVTAARALLYVLAALSIIGVVLSLPYLGDLHDMYIDAYKGTKQESAGELTASFVYIAPLFGVIFAVGYAVLGFLVGKGKNAARIVTWVYLGLITCCVGGSLALGSAASSLTNGADNPNGPDPKELADRAAAITPDWAETVSSVSNVLTVLAAIAVIVLLALPPSNGFFRKPAPVWVPPTGPVA